MLASDCNLGLSATAVAVRAPQFGWNTPSTPRHRSPAGFSAWDLPLSIMLLVLRLRNRKLVENVMLLAEKNGCIPGQLALAWLHAQVPPSRSNALGLYHAMKEATGLQRCLCSGAGSCIPF